MVREEAKASCFGGNMCSFFRQKKATTRVVQQRLCTVQSFKAIIAALHSCIACFKFFHKADNSLVLGV